MNTADDIKSSKVPAIVIDKKLEEYRGKVLFPEKLAKANAILEKSGFPELKEESNYQK
jgi:hypothetical protein